MASNDTTAVQREIPELHGIRGFAALLVFWYHARWKAGDPALEWQGLDFRGMLQAWDVGVCTFFVLSGSLLTTRFRAWVIGKDSRRPDLQKYLCRRVTRILPLYLFTVLIFSLFAKHTYTFYGLLDLALHATCLHTFCSYSYTTINPVLWTIGIEFQFYLLLPICMVILKSLYGRVGLGAGLLILLGGMWGCHISLQAVQHWLAPSVPEKILNPQSLPASVFYYFPWFWVGICLAFLPESTRERLRGGSAEIVCVFSLAGLVALPFFATEGQWRAIALFGWPLNCVLSAALVASAPAARTGRALFGNPLMYTAGVLSYGIYIWHWPIQGAVFAGTLPARLGGGGLSLIVCGGLALLICAIVSLLTYRLIEEPAVRGGRSAKNLFELGRRFSFAFLRP